MKCLSSEQHPSPNRTFLPRSPVYEMKVGGKDSRRVRINYSLINRRNLTPQIMTKFETRPLDTTWRANLTNTSALLSYSNKVAQSLFRQQPQAPA